MLLLDPPRHVAADLLDLLAEVVSAVTVISADTVSRMAGPQRTGRLQAVPAGDPAVGVGAGVGVGVGVAELATGVVAPATWPVQSAARAEVQGELAWPPG